MENTTAPQQTTSQAETKKITVPILIADEKRNTVRYDVPEKQFGLQVKGPVYLSKAWLLLEFGHLPKCIKLTVEEVPDGT